MKGNCIAYAVREFRSMLRAGWRKGEEPVLYIRPSRYRNGVLHCGVGRCDPLDNGNPKVWSFKPRRPIDAPWWLAWTRLWFDGFIDYGDAYRPGGLRSCSRKRQAAKARRDGSSARRGSGQPRGSESFASMRTATSRGPKLTIRYARRLR